MNIDGYALVEVNLEGETKLKKVSFMDIQLEHCDFDEEDMLDQLTCALSKETKDVLIMMFFKYQSVRYDYHEGFDYEDTFFTESQTIMQTNYKDFYYKQVCLEVGVVDGVLDQPGDNYYKELVAEYEEFYDEDFKWEDPNKPIKLEVNFNPFDK